MTMRAPAGDLPIVFDDTTVRVRDGSVLQSVSLVIGPGAPTILIGPNGAGKTTLIRLAASLEAPTSGALSWGGRPHTDGRRIAVLLQRPVMLRRSAMANIAYGLPRLAAHERRMRAEALLERVGLRHVGERPARRLSGGEQQRVALARALARDPEVLFLDEPTASLDPASTRVVEDVVHAAAESGVKVVMATQNLGQARRLAGEILFLLRGRVHERAPVDTFFNAPRTAEAAAFVRGDLVV
jgi:tungstate transport system ATP-binding protein